MLHIINPKTESPQRKTEENLGISKKTYNFAAEKLKIRK
jgi:hypothetical protein